MSKKSERKAIRKAKINEIQLQSERVQKSIRRHIGTDHAFKSWGKGMSILRAIHKEIEPILSKIRAAEDSIYRTRLSKQ